ncbi:hypothetical protein Efla_006665 [Eimeria flavescens]
MRNSNSREAELASPASGVKARIAQAQEGRTGSAFSSSFFHLCVVPVEAELTEPKTLTDMPAVEEQQRENLNFARPEEPLSNLAVRTATPHDCFYKTHTGLTRRKQREDGDRRLNLKKPLTLCSHRRVRPLGVREAASLAFYQIRLRGPPHAALQWTSPTFTESANTDISKMPVEFIAPALLAKGAAMKGVGGVGTSFLDPGQLMQFTPAGMAMNAAGGIASTAMQQASAHGGAGAGGVIEESLYLLPLLSLPFTSTSKRLPSGESRTIRLSTADSRGARYSEFL